MFKTEVFKIRFKHIGNLTIVFFTYEWRHLQLLLLEENEMQFGSNLNDQMIKEPNANIVPGKKR